MLREFSNQDKEKQTNESKDYSSCIVWGTITWRAKVPISLSLPLCPTPSLHVLTLSQVLIGYALAQ